MTPNLRITFSPGAASSDITDSPFSLGSEIPISSPISTITFPPTPLTQPSLYPSTIPTSFPNNHPTLVPTGSPVTTPPTNAPTTGRAASIRKIILGISDIDKLNDGVSPQSRALRWIIEDDARSLSANDPLLVQRFSLACFFYSTGGGSDGYDNTWRYSTNWLSAKHECEWVEVAENGLARGVWSCDNTGYVTKLQFPQSNLVGTLPNEFYELRSLAYMNFYGNSLSGTISFMVEKLTALKYLLAPRNMLYGILPESLYTLTNLQKLVLFENELEGSILSDIGGLTKLQELKLAGNKLDGTVPDSLFQLTNAIHISLEQNDLSGTISSTICSLWGGYLSSFVTDCATSPNSSSLPEVNCPCCSSCCDELGVCVQQRSMDAITIFP